MDSIRLARVRYLAETGHARRVRLAARVPLRVLAADVGVSPSTISRWEQGVRLPARRTVEAMVYLDIIERLARGDAS